MIEQIAGRQKLYEYDPDADSFAGVGFHVGDAGDDEDDDARVTKLHRTDTAVASTWQTLECRSYDDNPGKVGDFPSVSNYRKIPMVSELAWNILKPLIGEYCEALPIKHPFAGNFYLIHVMRTIDALDPERSEVDRSSAGDKRIRRIYRYAVKAELIEGSHIFKLPLLSGSGLLVDDVFRKTVEENGLQGLRFSELAIV